MKNTKNTEQYFKECDCPNCKKEGLYRAPKDRSLSSYYWFCLEHIKEYNKNWNYYKDLSPEDIELSIRHDTVWHKPTWKLGENTHISSKNLKDPFKLFPDSKKENHFQQKIEKPKYSKQVQEACDFLEIKEELTLAVLKKQYKKLAKKFHPDVSTIKNADILFKKLNEYYTILIKQLEMPNKK